MRFTSEEIIALAGLRKLFSVKIEMENSKLPRRSSRKKKCPPHLQNKRTFKNSNKLWSTEDMERLRELKENDISDDELEQEFQRPIDTIDSKWAKMKLMFELPVSLRVRECTVNQSLITVSESHILYTVHFVQKINEKRYRIR